MTRLLLFALSILFLFSSVARCDPPVASYIFPAGGRRGETVAVRVGGLNLHDRCSFEMLGSGVEASRELQRMQTLWFEGPLLALPESQQAEDYPRDMAGKVRIAADASPGVRYWRLRNSQGATPALRFVVGELPEVIEQETAGAPIPVLVTLPVTVNGRIFPREDVDIYSLEARKGQSITCEVHAARLGTPLDARLEVLDPQGRRLAENDDGAGVDSFLRFTAPADGVYQVRIHDINFRGGQTYVYRLTLTADPHVERVYPLGGRRGDTVSFELTGQGVPRSVDVALPPDVPRAHAHRFAIGEKRTNAVLLELDDLPELREAEPNGRPEQAREVTAPAILNGRVDTPGDVDCWAVACRKGEVVEFDLRAARLGSPLNGVLVLTGAENKELTRAEAGPQGDPLLRFTPPADGVYKVRVEERLRSRGGPAFAYRLRVDRPATPDFRLQLAADALTLNQGATVKLKVTTERIGGFAEAIALEIDGLPPGVTATGTTIAAKQTTTDIALKADATASVRADRLTVRGIVKMGDDAVRRTATLAVPRGEPELDSVLLAVAVPTPFKVVGEYDMRWAARGTVHQRRYRIERNGYAGSLEVRLADRQARHLQGVTGPTITVPADATEFDYAVFLPPWMETGRTSRVCVTAVGVVKDAGGTEHVVNFTSTAQNEQIVAVIEPGRLGIEATPISLTAVPGGTVSVKVRVARGKGLVGPARLELIVPAHLRGVSAEALEIAPDRSEATFPLRFGPGPGPFNMPLVLRATIMDKGRPVVAETELNILHGLPNP